ncbi:SMP-30/gluconolactonase/LRE family protein [Gelidibacter salicanalis]|uniref:SMP-30/gluconolactonase/LRE family protein n=1 Tax=Gelidibacter salicanalis TaxID=291193 RepID=A0A934KLC0_9FLAO|nr:SMP-30/gluconolactonase/LRE family protein [Gelidibacter salicanalis]MBJ7879324.1 SMP-30/gluconolactonase/LRE family protein [Gelidibacter salicanalis]
MKYISILALITLLTSCGTRFQSKEFTQEGRFTKGIEGPATDYEGNIYAVNFKEQGTIGKVTPMGESSVFVTLPNGSIGNGIRFGEQHQMFVADYVNHNILEIDLRSKNISIFAHEPTANQPNDLAISPDKTIYASDPNWAENTGKLWKVTKEKGFELLEKNMGTTNGIEVSPDGEKLYVNESVQRKIWVYDILADGSINNKTELISFADFGLDGMRCDPDGNLYVCRYDKGTVIVLSPTGVVLKEYQLKGQKPSNLTFSNDYKKVYVTLADKGNIEVIHL